MAQAFGIEIVGFDKLKQRMQRVVVECVGAGGKALDKEAQELLKESKLEVPIDTGALRDSGRAYTLTYPGGVVVSQVRYGKADVPYALPVHEDLQAHHEIGKAKYLEDPYRRRVKGIAARISRDLMPHLHL